MKDDNEHKGRRGERLNIPASTWNNVVDAAKDHKRNKYNGLVPVNNNVPLDDITSGNTIYLKNVSSYALATSFQVLKIGNPLEDVAEDPLNVNFRLSFDGENPGDENDPFAIVQSPLDEDCIGAAVFAGMAVTRVKMLDLTHKWANPTPSERGWLTSNDEGQARILWYGLSGDTGELAADIYLAVVDLRGTVCCAGTGGGSIPSSPIGAVPTLGGSGTLAASPTQYTQTPLNGFPAYQQYTFVSTSAMGPTDPVQFTQLYKDTNGYPQQFTGYYPMGTGAAVGSQPVNSPLQFSLSRTNSVTGFPLSFQQAVNALAATGSQITRTDTVGMGQQTVVTGSQFPTQYQQAVTVTDPAFPSLFFQQDIIFTRTSQSTATTIGGDTLTQTLTRTSPGQFELAFTGAALAIMGATVAGAGGGGWVLMGSVAYTAFAGNATAVGTYSVATLPAKTALQALLIRTKTPGAGGGVTLLVTKIRLESGGLAGSSGDGLVADNVDGQYVVNANVASNRPVFSWTATNFVQLDFQSDVALNALTAGEWEVYGLYSTLP